MRLADYLIEILSELLGEPSREVRFDWCRGDPSPARPRGTPLPFDAVWPELRLIVEVHEDQHRKPVKHFDKPDRLTVSGVHRGVQRRLYDQRKVQSARDAGFKLIEIPWDHQRRRDPARDRDRLVEILAKNDVRADTG